MNQTTRKEATAVIKDKTAVNRQKKEQGLKHDAGKPRFELLPPNALREVAEVYTFGALKYEDRNWERGISWGRVYGAVQRHLHAFWAGQDLDEESGLPHLAHAAFGLLALLEFSRTHPELDDRA
jgi:hypothetical protein